MDHAMVGAIEHASGDSSTVMDSRDLTIEALAHSEALLTERVADLTSERDSYRALMQGALDALHELTVERDRFRTRVSRLLKELRAVGDYERRDAA